MKKLLAILLVLLNFCSYSQQDCMGTESYNVNPLPQNGGYAPGTTVEYCITFNNWNTTPGTNWLEGFDMTLGSGWDLSTLTPTQYPPNAGGAGSGGQWLWVPNQFNGNPASAGGAGNQFGPGFFFDLNTNGLSTDDWGDFGTGPWNFCFEVTVGNTPGASLSLQVAPVSDGFAGSWGQAGCGGYYNFQVSPGNTVLGCLTPPVVAQQSVQDASCNGANDGQIAVSVAGGSAPFSYTVNGGPPSLFGGGAFFANLIAGNYVVVCTDDEGCVSDPLNVVVNENSSVQNNTSQLQDVLCFGESTGSFQITSNGGVQPYTYSMGPVSNQTGQFAGLPAGNYVVQVTDDNGCSNFHNVAINQIAQMTPQVITTANADCFGSSDGDCEISCAGGTPPYTYTYGAIIGPNGIFVDLFPEGNHLLTITDANGCESQQNVVIFQPPAIDIWQPLITDVDCFGNTNGEITIFANGGAGGYIYQLGPNVNNVGSFQNLAAGNYQIMVEDANGCQFQTPIVTVNGPQLPLTAQLTTDEPTCYGGADGEITADVSGGTAPYSLSWNTIPVQNTSPATNLTAGSYSINVTDANGCLYQDQVVLFQPNIILITTPNQSTVCLGQEITLISNQQNAVLPFNLSWTNNQNGDLNLESDIVAPSTNTTYTVTLTDANGCISQSTYTVTVNPLPDPSFSESSTTGCDKHCVDFNVSNPNVNYSYIWTFGDASISFEGENQKHCYNDEGVFTVFLQATSDKGCVDSLRKEDLIIINKTPTANFIIGPEVITFIDEPDFQFENFSQDAETYFWNMGDSTLSQEENPEHRYGLPGDYCVKLVAVANYTTGIPTCVDSVEKCLKILPLSVCYVPNTFSPNDDQVNDVFFVRGSLISQFEISIYNRWGRQVYRSFDIDNGWDGKYANEFLPSGVYIYTISYRDVDQGHHAMEGSIFLMR
jgi:gliding motility-associated-like protein